LCTSTYTYYTSINSLAFLVVHTGENEYLSLINIMYANASNNAPSSLTLVHK
jgi:hypothetical protein